MKKSNWNKSWDNLGSGYLNKSEYNNFRKWKLETNGTLKEKECGGREYLLYFFKKERNIEKDW